MNPIYKQQLPSWRRLRIALAYGLGFNGLGLIAVLGSLALSVPIVGICFYAFILGAASGGYGNLVCYRFRERIPLNAPSQCPRCRSALPIGLDLPFVGWVWLRGRAGCCGALISWRYPASELIGGLALTAMAWTVVG